jgi:hypothetical protein
MKIAKRNTSAQVMQDTAIALTLRAEGRMKSPTKFVTYPNAPVVVNRCEIVNGRKLHNSNPYRAKYVSVEGAEWMRDAMNKNANVRTVWYIAA